MSGDRQEVIDVFAFWKYDCFPYILGAKIKYLYSDGMIEPEGYPGFKFYPIAFFPPSEGETILKLVKKLEKEYKLEKELLKKLPYNLGMNR